MGRWSGAFRVLRRLADRLLRSCLADSLDDIVKQSFKISGGKSAIIYPPRKPLPAAPRGRVAAGSQGITIFAVILLLMWQMLAIQSVRAGDNSSHLDAFGNPLCISTTDKKKAPVEHKTLPICCVSGSQMVAGITPVEPETARLHQRLVLPGVETKQEQTVQPPPRDQQKYGPRAPPTAHVSFGEVYSKERGLRA